MTSRGFQMDPKSSKYNKCVNKFNVLNYFKNPTKNTKNKTGHFAAIINGCMNINRGRIKFSKIVILFNSDCSSMIIINRIMSEIQ